MVPLSKPGTHRRSLVTFVALPLLLSSASLPSGAPAAQEMGPGPDALPPSMTLVDTVRPEPIVAPSAPAAAAELPPAPLTSLTVDDAADDAIPTVALAAYERAAYVLSLADPGCGVTWSLLAAIGRVESDHGRYGGAQLGADGVSRPDILGPVLDGAGPFAAIPDTDAGAWDGDTRWDRAVGPMQFIPQTWQLAGVDGDGDGERSPHDLDDAAVAAAVYLCSHASGLSAPGPMREALLHYNHSEEYADLVMAYERAYRDGGFGLTHATAASQLLSLAPGAGVWSDGVGAFTSPELVAPLRVVARTDVDKGGPSVPAAPSATPSGTPSSTPPSATPSPATPSATPSAPATPTSPAAPTPSASPSEQPGTPGPGTGPSTGPADGPNEPGAPGSPAPEDPPPASGGGQPSDPPPQPGPTPEPSRLTGAWSACDSTWCVAGTPLDLGSAGSLELAAAADYDQDGALESRRAELDGLVGTEVTVTLAGSNVVVSIGEAPYPG